MNRGPKSAFVRPKQTLPRPPPPLPPGGSAGPSGGGGAGGSAGSRGEPLLPSLPREAGAVRRGADSVLPGAFPARPPPPPRLRAGALPPRPPPRLPARRGFPSPCGAAAAPRFPSARSVSFRAPPRQGLSRRAGPAMAALSDGKHPAAPTGPWSAAAAGCVCGGGGRRCAGGEIPARVRRARPGAPGVEPADSAAEPRRLPGTRLRAARALSPPPRVLNRADEAGGAGRGPARPLPAGGAAP